MCMLLMGCGSGGGFNPLSLNPTLLASPENSFSRTGGQFTSASSQYLSVASNSSLQIADNETWGSCWVYFDDTTGTKYYWSKWDGANFEYLLSSTSGGFQSLFRNAANSANINANDSFAVSAETWYHVFWFHSGIENLVGIIVNGRTAVTSSLSGGVRTTTESMKLGRGTGNYHNGRLDNVLFGKPPTSLGDGTSGSLAHTIATALYNSGNGLAFQDITSAQETDWGIVSGWLDNSLTADAFGSNTLTNNNSVTQAAGKVNAVAVENDPTYFITNVGSDGDGFIQIAVASRPIYDAVVAAINNKPAWIFDGTNDYMTIAGSVGGLSAVTMLAVVKYNDAGANQQSVNCNNSLAGFQQFSGAKYIYAGSGIYGSYADSSTDWNILVSRYDGSQTGNANRLKAYQNGGTAKTLSFTGTVPATLGAGSGDIWIGDLIVTGTAPHNGGLAYLIIIPATVTDQELNNLGNNAASFYGLSWADI